jgi:hypothetical protein
VCVTDRDHRDSSRNESAAGERLAQSASQAGEPSDEPDKREGANPGYSRPGLELAEIEAALDPDQQSAGKSGCDAERLPIPGEIQLSRSLCQRKCSAMKVEIK